jgi:SAM-dependent methyltransferase
MDDRKAWAEKFFSGLFVECWLQVGSDEMTRPEVEFVRKQLRLAPGARVLDVPCGGGRHACALAAGGCQVTGVDLSLEFLQAARERAAREKVSVTWEHRDMTDLPWPAAFDGVLCLGNSFGYYDDDCNARFLQAVAAALKPGGRFVLDYPAVAEALLPTYQERIPMSFGDLHGFRESRYDHAAGRIENEYTLIRGTQIQKNPASLRIYTYREVVRLLEAAGFADVQGYGSTAGEPFKFGAQRLLLVATKKEG